MKHSFLRLLFLGIFICLFVAGRAEARTWYIKADGSGDVATIQAAVYLSSDWDTILVAAGRYTGEDNKNINLLERILTVRSESGPHETIIDCQDDGRGFIFVSGESPATKLEGFTIMNARVEDGDGGGINCMASSPTISGCILKNNWAEGNGGGLCCSGSSSPTIADCAFIGNQAHYGGGLCCLSNSTPNIIECVMALNDAHGGGGVYFSNANASLSQCIVVDNSAVLAGGVGVTFSDPSILNTTIVGNRANLFGGGIDCINSRPVLSTTHTNRNSIYHNTAGQGGANLRTNAPIDAAQNIFWGKVNDSSVESLSVLDGMLFNAAASVNWWPISVQPRMVTQRVRGMADTLYFQELTICLDMISISIFGDTTVTVTAWPDSLPPSAVGGRPLSKWYDIAPGSALGAYSANLSLAYLQSEFDSSDIEDEASLYCARFGEGHWHVLPGDVDEENNRVGCTTSQFSMWAIGGDGGPLTAVSGEQPSPERPPDFRLSQNYPNPFNASTRISFSLPRPSHIALEIFNVSGQRVKTLVRASLPGGQHEVIWDGSNENGRPVGSGLYFCRLRADAFCAIRKIVLLR
jgi:parallel beta-helix repeat protein